MEGVFGIDEFGAGLYKRKRSVVTLGKIDAGSEAWNNIGHTLRRSECGYSQTRMIARYDKAWSA